MGSVYSTWVGILCSSASQFNVICEFAGVGLSSLGTLYIMFTQTLAYFFLQNDSSEINVVEISFF